VPATEPATPKTNKAKDEQDTPKQTPKQTPKHTPKQTPQSGSAVKPRARKPAKDLLKPFNPLVIQGSETAPVDVSYENETVNGKPMTDVGGYGQDIRLRAQQPFKLVTSVSHGTGSCPV